MYGAGKLIEKRVKNSCSLDIRWDNESQFQILVGRCRADADGVAIVTMCFGVSRCLTVHPRVFSLPILNQHVTRSILFGS